jgi:integrase
MQTDTLTLNSAQEELRAPRQRRNPRGVFQKVPGKNSPWWICYWDAQGRKRREKAGTKSAAIDLYRKRKNEALQGKKLPETLRRATVTFAEIATDALEYSRTTKVPDAYRIDRWHMETILAWFRERGTQEITPQDIERRLSELAEEGRKPATVNRYRALLSLIFSLAVRNNKVPSNPVRQVKRRIENNERVRFIDEKEEATLKEKIRELYPDGEPEFDLALHTGMRRGEQYRLRWQDVDLKQNILTIARSKHGEARYIQINSVARESLLKLRKRGDGLGYVCPGLEGPRNRDWRRWFEDVVSQAKIPNFRWHDLRHTFASRLVMAGVPLRAVQTLLGHKRLETTLRYSHLGESHLREAVERLTGKPTDTTTDTGHSGASEAKETKSA